MRRIGLAEGLEPHEMKEVLISGAVRPVGKGEWLDKLLRAWASADGKEAGVKRAENFKRMTLWRGDS